MKTRLQTILTLVVLLTAILPMGTVNTATSHETTYDGPPLSGAIFTTTENGDIVNENVRYEAKEDVYLDGGPGQNAPVGAAALPEGNYVFQVTDPSGKQLLSSDHWSCRTVHINEFGVISEVYPGNDYEKSKGEMVPVPCKHEEGVDVDHTENGAITVQLMPYDNTPNKGGVYKVWITPIAAFTMHDYVPTSPNEDPRGENYSPGNFHGFIPAYSKTDNYKVRGHPNFIPPEIVVKKFHDANYNGVFDEGEELVEGWRVDYTTPLGVVNTLFTTDSIMPDEGLYSFIEAQPTGTVQTAGYLDGVQLSAYPTADPQIDVNVLGDSEEFHEVLYGDAGLGTVEACKIYDADGDGIADPDETGIAGWKMKLTGTNILGEAVGPIFQFTGENGCTTFGNLIPGEYTVTEIMPDDPLWVSTSDMSFTVTIESSLEGSVISGSTHQVVFTNFYPDMVILNFDTKGYWHNKNGLQELTEADRDYVNDLSPYSSPSSYFENGDEPFDGYFSDGTPVDAAFNDNNGEMIWAAGTWQAEISHFLVDSNADAELQGHREQLAQQLLAFIFNVRHRNGGDTGDLIWDGTSYVSIQSIIDLAIQIWESGSDADRVAMSDLLDFYNNNDFLVIIDLQTPSPTYPAPVYS